MESSSVNALKRSCFKSVEGNGKSIALKCIFKTYRFGNVSWELHAHVLKYYKQCTPINIFGVHDRDSVENWPVWKRHHSLLWNLPLPLFFSDIFFAGILLLGGPSAFCMPATRTADAKHLKPCASRTRPETPQLIIGFYTGVAWRSLQQKCVFDFHVPQLDLCLVTD